MLKVETVAITVATSYVFKYSTTSLEMVDELKQEFII